MKDFASANLLKFWQGNFFEAIFKFRLIVYSTIVIYKAKYVANFLAFCKLLFLIYSTRFDSYVKNNRLALKGAGSDPIRSRIVIACFNLSYCMLVYRVGWEVKSGNWGGSFTLLIAVCQCIYLYTFLSILMSCECQCLVHRQTWVLAGHKTCLRVQLGSKDLSFWVDCVYVLCWYECVYLTCILLCLCTALFTSLR